MLPTHLRSEAAVGEHEFSVSSTITTTTTAKTTAAVDEREFYVPSSSFIAVTTSTTTCSPSGDQLRPSLDDKAQHPLLGDQAQHSLLGVQAQHSLLGNRDDDDDVGLPTTIRTIADSNVTSDFIDGSSSASNDGFLSTCGSFLSRQREAVSAAASVAASSAASAAASSCGDNFFVAAAKSNPTARSWGKKLSHLGRRKMIVLSNWMGHLTTNWKATLRYVLATLVGCSFRSSWGLTISQAMLSGWLVLQILGGWKFTKVVFLTVKRDAVGLYCLLKMKYLLRKNMNERQNIPSLFRKNVFAHPHKQCFLFEDQVWTFQDVYHFANRVSNYFQKEGFTKGDVVSLFMESRPEFVGFWLGLAAIGVETALVNFNLRTESLSHAAKVVNSKALIFSASLSSAVDEALRGKHLTRDLFLYSYKPTTTTATSTTTTGTTTSSSTPDVKDYAKSHASSSSSSSSSSSFSYDVTALEVELPKCSTHPPVNPPSVEFSDVMLYIFTSGTTGMPKAAVIKHQRYFLFAYGITLTFGILPDDIVYGCLPLYHTAGNNLGVGCALIKGCTVVLRKKFSASQFWKDCCNYKVTVIQYIGEICRYLLAQPSSPFESQHSVRLAIGNGLRPQIWRSFQTRFHVDQIGEFYGSTEGNTNIVNMTFREGCVGFTTRILPALHPVSLVKVDEETEAVVRGKDGLCIHCQPGEPGQLVGRIPPKDRFLQFDGYANQQATKKKIVFDVWKKGDMAFLSGDILVMDELGFMYFKDRTGDTFRWKGENVSTAEVEGIIMQILGLRDVVVYGVSVPGTEGKAGMAAIHVDLSGIVATGETGLGGCGDVSYPDLDNLVNEMKTKLPSYAQPLFIRFVSSIDATGTFKFKKVSLKEDGYDPRLIADSLFVFDANSSKYIPLDRRLHDQIQSGVWRL